MFTAFDLDGYSQCTRDYVELSNTHNFHTDLIWRRCGSRVPSQIFSTGRVLWVKFVSDLTRSDHGFRATYTMVIEDKGKQTVIIRTFLL